MKKIIILIIFSIFMIFVFGSWLYVGFWVLPYPKVYPLIIDYYIYWIEPAVVLPALTISTFIDVINDDWGIK